MSVISLLIHFKFEDFDTFHGYYFLCVLLFVLHIKKVHISLAARRPRLKMCFCLRLLWRQLDIMAVLNFVDLRINERNVHVLVNP